LTVRHITAIATTHPSIVVWYLNIPISVGPHGAKAMPASRHLADSRRTASVLRFGMGVVFCVSAFLISPAFGQTPEPPQIPKTAVFELPPFEAEETEPKSPMLSPAVPLAPVITPMEIVGPVAEPKSIPKKEEPKHDPPKEQPKKDEPYVVGSDLKMNATWKDGVFIETANRDFWFHPGGVLQYDGAFFQANDQVMNGTKGTGPLNDAANLRRFRLRIEGGFGEVLEFMSEFEFADGFSTGTPATAANTFNTLGPTDVWLQFNKLPVLGHVRIGNQKEWIGLEHLNSFRFLEFMERSLLFDAFIPTPFSNGFSPGISAYNTILNERAFWAVGAYKNERDLFGFANGDGMYAATGRLAALPIYENNGQRLLHVAVAGSYRDPVDGTVQFRVRPEIRNAPFPLLPLLANTGQITADSQQLGAAEVAAVLGPLTIQAEYTSSFLQNASQGNLKNLGTVFYQGWYVQATYFLTGEFRPYNKQLFAFGRVVPNEPYHLVDGVGGWLFGHGAWELAARYTNLDLSNSGINGGVLDNITLGVNWYLTSNSKIQWNYDFTHRTEVGGTSNGDIHAFGMRFALDF